MYRLLLTIAALLAPLVVLPGAARATPGDALQRWAHDEATARAPSVPGRVEVVVDGASLQRLAPPCTRPQPFLPAGARLWGRTRLGLRCESPSWSAVVPATVRLFGPALVATRPLSSAQPLSAEDFNVVELEWTREPQGVVTDPSQLDGRILARSLSVGQPVPLVALRIPQAVQQGDPVKLVGHGQGFAVSAAAVALSGAADGQSVRVRTESGRILSGTARTGRVVEVTF
jgi:flagella basal body P-ring formation protein FlgA